MLANTVLRYFGVPENTTLGQAFLACALHIRLVFWFSALVNLLYLAPSIYMLQVYDRVLTTQSVATLLFVSFALLLALAALGGLDFVRGRILARMALRLERRIAPYALRASLTRADRSRRSEATRALDNMRLAFSGPGIQALFDLPWTPLYLLICFLLHWSLGLLALMGALILTSVAIASERSQRAPLMASVEAAGAANLAHETAAAGGDVALAMGMRDALLERDRGLREAAATASAGALAAQARFASISKVLRLFVQSALLGWGGWLAIQGLVSPGAIIAASIIAARALAPIDMLVGSWRQMGLARDGIDTLKRVLAALEREPRGVVTLSQPVARLLAEGVSVARLDGGPGHLLGKVSLSVSPGEVVALSGPSGSGKTTLARVMAGALLPSEGAVRLDGVDLPLWEEAALGRLIGYMPQQPVLYPGTLVDNISRFSRYSGISESEVMSKTVAAARIAGVHEMIMRLPQGYQTQITPFGGGVSVGQAQRISLARAVYGDPIVLILDEPNASLDHDGENALIRCLFNLKKRGACVLVVAHRVSLATVIDRIAVLKDGVIEKIGPKEDFMKPQRPSMVVRSDQQSMHGPPRSSQTQDQTL